MSKGISYDSPLSQRLQAMVNSPEEDIMAELEKNLEFIQTSGMLRPERHSAGRIVQATLEDLQPGHQVTWDKNPYYHHAIIVNVDPKEHVGYVINYNHEITFNKAVAKVVLEKKDFSQQIGTFGKLNYISCDAPEVVLARAFTMLKLHGEINDEGCCTCCFRCCCQCCTSQEECYCKCCCFTCDYHGYNLFSSNCEHFANWTKTGEWKSVQVAKAGRLSCYRAMSFYWHFIVWTLVRLALNYVVQVIGSDEINLVYYIPFIDGNVEMISLAVAVLFELTSFLYTLITYACECQGLYERELEEMEGEPLSGNKKGVIKDIIPDRSRGCCDTWTCLCRNCWYDGKERTPCCGVDCCRAQDCLMNFFYTMKFVIIVVMIAFFHFLVNYIGYQYFRSFWSNKANDSYIFVISTIAYVVALLLGEVIVIFINVTNYCCFALFTRCCGSRVRSNRVGVDDEFDEDEYV